MTVRLCHNPRPLCSSFLRCNALRVSCRAEKHKNTSARYQNRPDDISQKNSTRPSHRSGVMDQVLKRILWSLCRVCVTIAAGPDDILVCDNHNLKIKGVVPNHSNTSLCLYKSHIARDKPWRGRYIESPTRLHCKPLNRELTTIFFDFTL